MADSATSTPYVTAILVVHDGATWLPEVVASLASQTRPIDYTLAIDTGSRDASLKLLTNARVPTFSLPRDTGFGSAISEALKTLTPRDNEWIWIIHDDCAPQPGALEALLAALAERPQVVMAGPKLRGWYDRSHLLEAGVSIANNGARWTGMEPHEYDQGQHDGIRQVLSVSTAGMLLRRDVFEELGGFDRNLSLFRDDVDLGWRINVAGYSAICVTDAVAFHAEAAASERRKLDVKRGVFKRPLVLDRRNAAYVLLTNSSWWLLPWLSVQLLFSAAWRAGGYLLAKLPGYASDEVLAIGLLLVRPGLIGSARRFRKSTRLISPRSISNFIPPRWSQLRLGYQRISESMRQSVLLTRPEVAGSLESPSEEEDLLAPADSTFWRSIVRRPGILAFLFLFAVTSIWSVNRYGSILGGVLPASPAGATDLWNKYGQSWHQVGLGSAGAAPTWVAILALLSTIFFGKAAELLSVLFWAAPLIFMWSMHSLLRRLSENKWLRVGASLAYALSPVAIAAIDSGRLGTIAVLILGPRLVNFLTHLKRIETVFWRQIFGISLLVGVLTAFSFQAFLGIAAIYLLSSISDFKEYRRNPLKSLLLQRLGKRATLIVTPFALCMPWSFEALLHPSRLLLEPGLLIPGGNPNLTILANPGGPGSLPWWILSPIAFVLVISALSSGMARKYAEVGLLFLLSATFLSAFTFAGHASRRAEPLWIGSPLAYATIASVCAAVVILSGLHKRLAQTRFHYRHVLAGLAIGTTILYGLSASTWALTSGRNSPVRAGQPAVLPPFLAITPGVKTLVMRNISNSKTETISFFIARESDATLSDPDVAPRNPDDLDLAVRQIVDGSGIGSSKVLAAYGITYLFMKNPVDPQFARVVDGLGGFVRTSSTQAGVVWKVAGISDRLVFTDSSGKSIPIPSQTVSARGFAPGPGTLTLSENYNRAWKVIQNGKELKRTRNSFGLPQFEVPQSGEFILIHDGTSRRGWLSLQVIALLWVLMMMVPSGRRRSRMSLEELT